MYESTTIDQGDETATIVEQHDLAGRLEQLSRIAEHGSFADDHVIHQLLRRYEHYRAEAMRSSA